MSFLATQFSSTIAAIHFITSCRIDTPVEVEYYRNGGVLQTVLRRLMKSAR